MLTSGQAREGQAGAQPWPPARQGDQVSGGGCDVKVTSMSIQTQLGKWLGLNPRSFRALWEHHSFPGSGTMEAPLFLRLTQSIVGAPSIPRLRQSIVGAPSLPRLRQSTVGAPLLPRLRQSTMGARLLPRFRQSTLGAPFLLGLRQSTVGAPLHPRLRQSTVGAELSRWAGEWDWS